MLIYLGIHNMVGAGTIVSWKVCISNESDVSCCTTFCALVYIVCYREISLVLYIFVCDVSCTYLCDVLQIMMENNLTTARPEIHCGSDISVEPLDIAAVVFYAPMGPGDMDFVTPLPASAQEDIRAFGPNAGIMVMYESERFQPNSESFLSMTPSMRELRLAALASSKLLSVAGVIGMRPYAMPDQFSEADFEPGIRFYASAALVQASNGEIQGFSNVGIQNLQHGGARLGLMFPGSTYLQYVEQRDPSPPPPPPISPLPPPPMPEIFSAPIPPPILESNELDTGIISGPVVAGIALCAYIIYVFAQRRRLLQQIHLDYDDIQQDGHTNLAHNGSG